MMSEAASAPGRFLTANFFHVALTGLNGLALFRACTRGMSGLNDLMLMLPLTITAHGLYNALLDLPDIDGGGFLAMVVYVSFSLYFFNRIHALRSNAPMTLKPDRVVRIRNFDSRRNRRCFSDGDSWSCGWRELDLFGAHWQCGSAPDVLSRVQRASDSLAASAQSQPDRSPHRATDETDRSVVARADDQSAS